MIARRDGDRDVQPTSAPTTTTLPGGGIRVTTTLTDDVVSALGRADFYAKRILWLLVPVIVGVPAILAALGRTDDGPRAIITSLLTGLLFSGAVGALFVALLLRSAAPDHQRRLTPPGTQMYADFTPDWIGLGRTDSHTVVARELIVGVREVSTALLVRTSAHQNLLIPDALVPAAIRDDLLARPRRRRRGAVWPRADAPTSAPPEPAAYTGAPPTPKSDAPPYPPRTAHTVASADDSLPTRLSRAVRSTTAARVAAITAIPFLIAVTALAWGTDNAPAQQVWTVAVVAACAGTVGYLIWIRTPAAYAAAAPPGAPLAADFGPEWITLRLGGYVESRSRASIWRVRPGHAALSVTSLSPPGGTLIPDELVPAEISVDLQRRHSSRRRRRALARGATP
ncbi:hypothetical protein QSJ18_05045 [Gordonia sp. ABSL1-1]|uniref:hypothetical protein n=1 Tax=Gordonia sp. ABSL1-1 TaxID=3053923 RepID=UPI0025733027|nr:hypothetical protein [Gordonia sp. ABSL1-1]MDL9936099.1 hypothetical protein [Gordonia sp. ABSL1-1]